MTPIDLPSSTRVAFIGGGNMAGALVGGLVRQGMPPARITVLDPGAAARERLAAEHGITTLPAASAALEASDLIVWAVKPQVFRAAAAPVAPFIGAALQLSIMAGIRCDDIVAASGHARLVRCMPNTPALIGQGVTALFATPGATGADRQLAEAVMRTAGDALWVAREELLDAVTALSGSGPAYVFYFLEAMQQAGVELGLTPEQARQLAVRTFAGGAALAAASPEPLATLRERVTSKGGTTFAALEVLRQAGVARTFGDAMRAAHRRAGELGAEFGAAGRDQ